MAITSTLTMTLSAQGDGLNETFTPPIVITNTNAPGGGGTYSLSTGFNTITVPAGALGFILMPSANSSIGKTLKGITGDTGFPISALLPGFYPLPTNTANINITVVSAEVVRIYWF